MITNNNNNILLYVRPLIFQINIFKVKNVNIILILFEQLYKGEEMIKFKDVIDCNYVNYARISTYLYIFGFKVLWSAENYRFSKKERVWKNNNGIVVYIDKLENIKKSYAGNQYA